MSQEKVIPIRPQSRSDSSSGNGSGSGEVYERLTALETHMQYLATKKEVSDLKIWVLSGVLGGMGIAVVIALSIAKLVSI